jgi:hypothetical protein
MESARLLQARLPPSFWWFAMIDTIEVDSYIPIVDSPSETPYSRFVATQPSITHVRALGCLAYPLLNSPATKMSGRAARGINLDRAPEQSSYVVYEPNTGVTPHVRFVETEFPGVGPLLA